MTTLRQAAQQALEALEWSKPHADASITYEEAIANLRAALAEQCTHGVTDGNCKECYMAEPEQEPVAWVHLETWMDGKYWPDDCFSSVPVDEWQPLYTAPPQRKPLTDEEIEQAYRNIWRNIPADFDHTSMGWIEQGIRYAEQAHGIKGDA